MRSATGSGESYQRELARSLIRSIGVDGAIDCARRFQWEGVLAEVLALARPHPS